MHSYYGDLGHAYPSGDDSVIVGLCTGLLPSAAVSSSRTAGELVPISVLTVVLSLQLGLCVHSTRSSVDTRNSSSTSWSALVSGISESEALENIEAFSNQQVSSSELKLNFFLKKNSDTNKRSLFLRIRSPTLALFPQMVLRSALLQQPLTSLSRVFCPRITSPFESPFMELTMRLIYMIHGTWRGYSLSGQMRLSLAMCRKFPCFRATRESLSRLAL